MGRSLRCTVGVAALTVLLAGCGGPVPAADVETSIEELAENSGWALETADCPTEVPAEVGAVVICAVQIQGEIEVAPGEVGVVDRVRVVVRGIDRGTPRYTMHPLTEGTAP